MEGIKTLKVKTLDHALKFDGKTFKVGCQTISFEDAQKLAEFIQNQERVNNRNKLPEKFSLEVPSLSFGREVCKLLFELGIKTHGRGGTLEDSLAVFDRIFEEKHKIFNIDGYGFSGCTYDYWQYEVITIDELIKAVE